MYLYCPIFQFKVTYIKISITLTQKLNSYVSLTIIRCVALGQLLNSACLYSIILRRNYYLHSVNGRKNYLKMYSAQQIMCYSRYLVMTGDDNKTTTSSEDVHFLQVYSKMNEVFLFSSIQQSGLSNKTYMKKKSKILFGMRLSRLQSWLSCDLGKIFY